MTDNYRVIASTPADMEAHLLLTQAGRICVTSSAATQTYMDSGNSIIELAAKIKAQRSQATLTNSY